MVIVVALVVSIMLTGRPRSLVPPPWRTPRDRIDVRD